MLMFNIFLKVGGFLNADLAEKQFNAIAVMLSLILFAQNGKNPFACWCIESDKMKMQVN